MVPDRQAVTSGYSHFVRDGDAGVMQRPEYAQRHFIIGKYSVEFNPLCQCCRDFLSGAVGGKVSGLNQRGLSGCRFLPAPHGNHALCQLRSNVCLALDQHISCGDPAPVNV